LAKIQWEKAKVVLVARGVNAGILSCCSYWRDPHSSSQNMVVSPKQQEFIMPSGVPRLVVQEFLQIRRPKASQFLEASWRSKATSTYESVFKQYVRME